MFAGHSLARSRKQAQANADQTQVNWCLFTDSSLNFRICRESQAPDVEYEVFYPFKKKDPSMLERLEALCRAVAKLDDNGPDPNVFDVKQEAEALIAKFFTPEGEPS